MKILILSSEFPPGPGGIGTNAYQLAHYFNDCGETVQVITAQDYESESNIMKFNLEQSFDIIRLPTLSFALFKWIARLRCIKQALDRFNPDILLASGSRAIWVSAFILLGKATPWVVIGHGSEFGASLTLKSFFTRISANQASAAICVSNFTRKVMQNMGITKPTP